MHFATVSMCLDVLMMLLLFRHASAQRYQRHEDPVPTDLSSQQSIRTIVRTLSRADGYGVSPRAVPGRGEGSVCFAKVSSCIANALRPPNKRQNQRVLRSWFIVNASHPDQYLLQLILAGVQFMSFYSS